MTKKQNKKSFNWYGQKQRFSLRKYTFGLCSALLGTLVVPVAQDVVFPTTQVAYAAETTVGSSTEFVQNWNKQEEKTINLAATGYTGAVNETAAGGTTLTNTTVTTVNGNNQELTLRGVSIDNQKDLTLKDTTLNVVASTGVANPSISSSENLTLENVKVNPANAKPDLKVTGGTATVKSTGEGTEFQSATVTGGATLTLEGSKIKTPVVSADATSHVVSSSELVGEYQGGNVTLKNLNTADVKVTDLKTLVLENATITLAAGQTITADKLEVKAGSTLNIGDAQLNVKELVGTGTIIMSPAGKLTIGTLLEAININVTNPDKNWAGNDAKNYVEITTENAKPTVTTTNEPTGKKIEQVGTAWKLVDVAALNTAELDKLLNDGFSDEIQDKVNQSTPELANKFNDILNRAEDTIINAKTQEEINAAYEELKKAIAELTVTTPPAAPVVDKAPLTTAKDALVGVQAADTTGKTQATVDAYNTAKQEADAAVAEAQKVLDNPAATEAEVAAAKKTVEDAKAKLEAAKNGLQDEPAAPVVEKGSVTVSYVDADSGKEIIAKKDVVRDVAVGTEYKTDEYTYLTQDGKPLTLAEAAGAEIEKGIYVRVAVDTDNEPSGKVKAGEKHVQYAYMFVQHSGKFWQVMDDEYSIIVKYVDETGKEISRDASWQQTYAGKVSQEAGQADVQTLFNRQHEQSVQKLSDSIKNSVEKGMGAFNGNIDATAQKLDTIEFEGNTYEYVREKENKLVDTIDQADVGPIPFGAPHVIVLEYRLKPVETKDGELINSKVGTVLVNFVDEAGNKIVDQVVLKDKVTVETTQRYVTKSGDQVISEREEKTPVQDTYNAKLLATPIMTAQDGKVYEFVERQSGVEAGDVQEGTHTVVYKYKLKTEDVVEGDAVTTKTGSVDVKFVNEAGEELTATETVLADAVIETKATIVTKSGTFELSRREEVTPVDVSYDTTNLKLEYKDINGKTYYFIKIADNSATETGKVGEGKTTVVYVYRLVEGEIPKLPVETVSVPNADISVPNLVGEKPPVVEEKPELQLPKATDTPEVGVPFPTAEKPELEIPTENNVPNEPITRDTATQADVRDISQVGAEESEKAAVLPKTGSDNSATVALGLAMLAASLGLTGKRYKKRK